MLNNKEELIAALVMNSSAIVDDWQVTKMRIADEFDFRGWKLSAAGLKRLKAEHARRVASKSL